MLGFGSKEIKDAWYAATGFGFVFEVTDDPLDDTPYREQSKAISVWLLGWSDGTDSEIRAWSLEKLMAKRPMFVGSITRNTPIESRRWSTSTLDRGWVSVIVAPTVEWEHFYSHRVYPAVAIQNGFRGNFTISLPPRKKATAAITGEKSGSAPRKELNV